jgi:hypothetical protein
MMRLGATVALAGTFVLMLAASALGYEVRAFDGTSRAAKVEDFSPRIDKTENSSNKFYGEQYSFDTRLDGDANFWFQIVISNMGLSNGKAGLLVDFKPDGKKKIKARTSLERAQWSYDTSGGTLTLKLGDSTFSGDGKQWKGHFVTDQFDADFTVTNAVAAYRPGGGAVYYGAGNDYYYDITVLTPRGRFEADVTLKETGEKVHLAGTAYGDHSVMNLSPNFQAKRWARFRTIGSSTTVIVSLFETAPEYQGKWVGWIMVVSDKGIVGCGVNPKVEVSDFDTDEKSGYSVPRVLVMSEASGLEGFQGAIQGTKRTARKDKLADLSAVERAVVSKLVQPIEFKYSASYELKFTAGGKDKSYKGNVTYQFEQITK